MKNTILVIDDDENMLKVIEAGLKNEGFKVLTSNGGLGGLRNAFNNHPDLILLDIMMPGMDGLDVCQRLRELSSTPIIMLTALSSTSDVVKGLRIGADDYVTKPFSMAELVARIQACLRRKESPSSPSMAAVLSSGNLMIDLARHKVTVDGKAVQLTPTEFHLLSHLMRNCGQVIPHRTLLIEVWGFEYADQVDYLHLYVRYLRQKIERDPSHPEVIKTQRGVGYYLDEN